MNTRLYRVLLPLLVAVLLAPPFHVPANATAATVPSAATPGTTATAATSAPVPSLPDDWWAAARANILRDLDQAGGGQGIDGLSPAPAWQVTGEQVNDLFATSVAGAGDVNGDGFADVIVGAPGVFGTGKQGKAYLFLGSATGLETTWDWSQLGENTGDQFGWSVAGAGDVNGDGFADVVVGAIEYADVGRAYLFLGSETGLGLSPLPPLDGEHAEDVFGSSVAGAGDVNGDGYADVLVGAPGYDDGPRIGAGRVYLYHGGASGPDTTPDLVLTGENQGDRLGNSVAGAGDVNGDGFGDVIVGADGQNGFAGAAYVYHGSTGGIGSTWDWQQSGVGGDRFGYSVAGAGDVNGDGFADVVVGARLFGGNGQGAVYVYHGGSAGLGTIWSWVVIGVDIGEHLGTSVAGAGDVNGDGYADVLIGADGYTANTGRADLYQGGPGGLATDPCWTEAGESTGSAFGGSVASAGDVNGDGYADAIVGADRISALAGKAYAYHGRADLPNLDVDWSEEGVNIGDSLGIAVAGAGDVNGDGYSDVILGADGFGAARGRVYVYHGSITGLPSFPDWHADGEQDGDFYGGSAASAGDVNGDGYADVIVGAIGYDRGTDPVILDAGRAYVYYGSVGGLGTTPAWIGTGEASDDHYGVSVAGAGDVNGDGLADVLVGADGHAVNTGRVYVYHGSANGLSSTPDQILDGAARYEYFGHSAAGAGDVNGDGYADVAVGAYGAPGSDGGGTFRGKVQVFYGSPSGVNAMSIWSFQGENDGDYFGFSIAGVGDVSGDGDGDILVGAYQYGGGRGKAYLYDLSAPTSTPAWAGSTFIIQPDFYGYSVAGAGDVNGDGYADLLVGARNAFDGSMRGYAVLYLGPRSGTSALGDWGVSGENDNDLYGISVAGAGDVDGDGYADVLVGATGYGTPARGKVYLYLGNGGGGQSVLARPMQQDSDQIQPWGLADAPDMFEVRMGATNPAGRARIKLEAEACPAGTPFGAVNCVIRRSATWLDTVPTGGLPLPRGLSVTMTDLESETLVHWRARVLYAPYTVIRTGITPPRKPAHGPWRRFQGQAFEADLRTMASWQIFLPLVSR